LAAGVALALAALLFFGAVRFGVARSRLPERGVRVESIPGLPAEVEVRFDTHGIPHVTSDDEEALWFAQGYLHARDRFFQMELARRLASGRLAELLGAGALPSDRRMRTWRLAASARRQVALLDAEAGAVLEAYTAGVNAALDRFGSRISPEIWMIGVEPEPWRPECSLEVALLLQLDLSWSMGEELQRAEQLARLGRDRAVELWGWSPEEERSWLPPGELELSPREEHDAIRPPISGAGSNGWALAPSRTATGRPLLAVDPHLAVQLPVPFALIHLRGPDLHVVGASLPGTPGVLIGHNEHVAWGFTAAMLDDQDLYVLTLDEEGENELVDGTWLRVRTVTEEIRVRWRREPVVVKIRLSERGPLVRDAGGEAIALSWTGLSGAGTVRAFLDLGRARGIEDAARAWQGVIGPSLDLIAADTGGHILQQVVGLVPDRGRGAGRLPSPGADSRWGWRGFLPLERNPRSVDPPSGVIATANHNPYAEGDVGADRPLPGDFAPPWRLRRIRRVLEVRDDWNVGSTLLLQRDEVSERAIAVLKLLREDLEAHGGPTAAALLSWDARMATDAVAPHLFSRLLLELDSAVGADELAGGGEHGAGIGAEALVRLLAGGLGESWWDDGATLEVEGRGAIVAAALDAVDARADRRAWGEVHQISYRHPLADLPVAGRVLASSWSRGPFPTAGDEVTIGGAASSPHRPFEIVAAPVLRFVADVGDWDRSVVVLPLGQSGRPWSSHYADQIQAWRRGEAFPLAFSEQAVEEAAEAVLVLRPKHGE
jgi:penicillin amidase